MSHTPVVNLPSVQSQTVQNGSIYQAASYRPLFGDYRARLVGDTLTVSIVEKVSAAQTSTSELSKSGSLAAGVTAAGHCAQQLWPRLRRRQQRQHQQGQGQQPEHQ